MSNLEKIAALLGWVGPADPAPSVWVTPGSPGVKQRRKSRKAKKLARRRNRK